MKYLGPGSCLLLVLLCACAGPTHFEPIQAADNTEAVLYLYRPRADNPGLQPLRLSYPDILIDGNSVGVLSFDRHRAVRITPGEHTVTATGLTEKSKWEPVDKELKFHIEPGEVKYIKLNVQFDIEDMNLGHPGAKYLIYLTPVDADAAIYEIRETSEED